MPTWLTVIVILAVLVGLGSLMGRAETKKSDSRRDAFGGEDDVAYAVCDVLMHAARSAGSGGEKLLPEIRAAAERILNDPVDDSRLAAAFALVIKDADMMDVGPQVAPIPDALRDTVAVEAAAIYALRRRFNPDDTEAAIYLRRMMTALKLDHARARAILIEAAAKRQG